MRNGGSRSFRYKTHLLPYSYMPPPVKPLSPRCRVLAGSLGFVWGVAVRTQGAGDRDTKPGISSTKSTDFYDQKCVILRSGATKNLFFFHISGDEILRFTQDDNEVLRMTIRR